MSGAAPRDDAVLEAARVYAARGWPVFPLGGGGDPKRPRIRDWPSAASTDPKQLAEWWARWPGSGVAIVTGARSGVVAIDLDDDAIGGEGYARLLAEHGPPGPPECQDGAAIRTGREGGGWRLLLGVPEGVVIRKGTLAPGVEFMANGGSAIMPPSPHSTGRRYVWRDPIPAGGLPRLSPSWVELLRPPPPSAPRPSPWPADFDGVGSRYGRAALRGELERLAAAEQGTRNETLNAAAFAVGSLAAAGHLDAQRALEELVRVALEIGLDLDEVKATIRSGLEAGHRNPRTAA